MNSNEGLFGFIPTRQRKLLIISVSLLVAALLVLTALAITGEFTPITTPGASNPAQGEVKIWQEKESPAYVPVRRDSTLWRSVRMPAAEAVESLLRAQGRIPMDATPDQIDQALQGWYSQAQKDAFFGPDPRAYRDLMTRRSSLTGR